MTGRYLQVRDLLRAPGVQRHDTGTCLVEGGEIASARLRDEGEVAYDLILEARGSRVTVGGTVAGTWTGPCRRCLEPTEGDFGTRISEIFELSPTPGETWPINDGLIDLEPVLREALLLELPLAPLCRDDCEGPDPQRYPTSSEDDEAEDEPPADPRWAALASLKIDEPGDSAT